MGDFRTRFVREARYGQEIASQHIISYLDEGEVEDIPFLVMELAQTSLREYTKQHGAPSVDEINNVVQACVSGLVDMHRGQHVHRDVKPGNILRRPDGRYVLGDLGIVKWGELSSEFTDAGTLTTADIRLGSIKYMAPEQQTSAHDVSPACDVYSLGVVWYELLTGHALSQAEAARQRFKAASDDASVAKIIAQMVEYEPEDRPSLADIQAVLDGIGPKRVKLF